MTNRRTLIQGALQAAAAGVFLPSGAQAASIARPEVEQVSLSVAQPYDDVVARFEATLGRWDPAEGSRLVRARVPWHEVEDSVARMAGPTGLMIFSRIDQGELLSLYRQPTDCCLYLVGNPVVANSIIDVDIRASFYVPFRVGLYGLNEPTTLVTYDRPSSFLKTLGHPALNDVGQMLDGKIDAVMHTLNAR